MTGIEKAIEAKGGVTALAEAVGVTQPLVSHWLKRGYVSKTKALRVAEATGVPRWELCDPRLVILVRGGV